MGYYDMYGMPVSMERWSQLFAEPRHIGEDFLTIRGRQYHVSTVWLGLDHSFGGYGPPIIFETMIFEGRGLTEVVYQDRYSTITQAREGHWRATRWLYRELGVEPKALIHNGRRA